MERWIIYVIIFAAIIGLLKKVILFLNGKNTSACCSSAGKCNSFCGCGNDRCKTEK